MTGIPRSQLDLGVQHLTDAIALAWIGGKQGFRFAVAVFRNNLKAIASLNL